MSPSRRQLLGYTALAALPAIGLPAAASAAPADDLAHIVAGYREMQVGRGRSSAHRDNALAALDTVAVGYDRAMDVGGDQLWADLPTGPGSTWFPSMYYRLRTIAVDWATPGSALSTKAGQWDRIHTALSTLYRVQYNERTAELGNWYVYEIGVPYWLLQVVVAAGDRLTDAERRTLLAPVLRFVADPNRRTATPGLVETGANRADKALIAVVSGALLGDPSRVRSGLDAVSDVAGGGAAALLRRVTTGDGYHTDGSFLQHDVVPYPGHYGLVLLTAAAGLLRLTAGTALAPPADVVAGFQRVVTDVYAPFLVDGAMSEPVRGRMLSRQGETGHDAGHQFIAAVVQLARVAAEPERSRLAGLAARFIADGRWAPYLDVADVGRFAGGLQAVGVPEVEDAEELLASRPRRPARVLEHRPFPQQDRVVHATAGWSATLALSSTRICRYEAINGQNLHGWYTGDGVLYTHLRADQGHYSDAYWPTVDATLLPGTTEAAGAPPPLAADPPRTGTPFAGGVAFDAAHGAQALDFAAQAGTVTARKSWFFTGDAVLCLGAGITGGAGTRVLTTIENRLVHGDPALTADGRPVRTGLGTPVTLTDPGRLHLAGVGGYRLLDRASVAALREDRTGTWHGIDTGANTHGTDVPYTRRFQKIVLDHGVAPAGARYAYAVLPTAPDGAGAGYRVLANTAGVQAVRLDRGIVAAVFFAAGRQSGITVSGPACVMCGPTAEGWRFALADPGRTADGVRVTVRGAPRHVVRADPGVTVVSTAPDLRLMIDLRGALGGTRSVLLR